jgi:preprotein translocase subunit SecF
MRIFANANYNFIKWRWHALIISMVIIWGGVAWIFTHGGLPLGIDFSGGTMVVVDFEKPTNEDVVRNALSAVSKDVGVQRYGSEQGRNEIMVRLPEMKGEEKGQVLEDGVNRIEAALKAANVGKFQFASKDIVGPVMGKDLQSKGIWATLAALGGILIYVMFRFRFTFAVGAIVAAFHDILITLVFLALFHFDLSLNIIAGLLTITGYSVNDTIVVFDRVRENQRIARREPLDQIVNRSVNQTLGRTVITSSATFLAVLALFLFGGEVLHGFAFTMLVGVVTGTYSTVFIAAAIAIILSRRENVQSPAAPAAAAAKRKKS